MSVDYDRLRKLVDEHTPGPWEQAPRGQIGNRALRMIVAFVGGDESGEEIGDSTLEADRELIALAPDLVRELLHLLGVVERFDSWLTVSAKNATTPGAKNIYLDAQYVLTELLEGDTE